MWAHKFLIMQKNGSLHAVYGDTLLLVVGEQP